MKKAIVYVNFLCLSLVSNLFAGPAHEPYRGTAAFEKMKLLAGHWECKNDMDPNGGNLSVEYQVTSGGSAISERLSPGQPNEMITMYYEKDGHIMMTHYCMLGNRPIMSLVSEKGNQLNFSLVRGSGIHAGTETHMHSLSMDIIDADHVTEVWSLYEKGKQVNLHTMRLTRVK